MHFVIIAQHIYVSAMTFQRIENEHISICVLVWCSTVFLSSLEFCVKAPFIFRMKHKPENKKDPKKKVLF